MGQILMEEGQKNLVGLAEGPRTDSGRTGTVRSFVECEDKKDRSGRILVAPECCSSDNSQGAEDSQSRKNGENWSTHRVVWRTTR